MIGRGILALGDLIFPRQCLACGDAPAMDGFRLCRLCDDALAMERAVPCCPACAASTAPYEAAGDVCGRCRAHTSRLQGVVRVGPDVGRLRRLLRAYKYHDREEIEPLLGRWLGETVGLASWRDRVEAVVAVPTHWTRHLGRAVYPARPLAARAARAAGLPVVRLLKRTQGGLHQIGLTYPQRIANVRGVFALRKGVTLRKARLLLIDDVMTSGATLNECAKILRREGASEVYAAIVARAGEVNNPALRFLDV